MPILSAGIVALIYSILGFGSNNKRTQEKFNLHKSAFTLIMALLVAFIMLKTGFYSGYVALDGLAAVQIGSMAKKGLLWLAGKKKK